MLFNELVQVALGTRERLSRVPSKEEWEVLLDLSKKQAICGVTFLALDKLSAQDIRPPKSVLLEWIGLSEQIKAQNVIVNNRCVEISTFFLNAGFKSCILKGQGNALLYSNPLLRNSGDIDLWVEGSRSLIQKFVLKYYPDAEDGEKHIEIKSFKGIPVDVHYKPRCSPIPKYDKRLQFWSKEKASVQFNNFVVLYGTNQKVCTPTAEFNAIQQLSDIMGHFFVEGIGLRQFIDYYYVLRKLHVDYKASEIEEITDTIRWLGMKKFARGVMWIEREYLGLADEYLLVEPDERLGKVILSEIEEGGNFGMYDQRYSARSKGILMRGLIDTYRLLKLAYYFPEDALWKILRKVENQKWKIRNARN